jgi:PhnB protein
VGRYKDLSTEARKHFSNCKDEEIMHITLRINKDIVIMGADMNNDALNLTLSKNTFAIYINAHSKEEANQFFSSLSINGNILVPLEDQFWNSYYGLCIDQYGISWKISWSEENE